MNELTPRTDAEMDDVRNIANDFICKNPVPKKNENLYVVPLHVSRTLERELAAAKREIDALKQALLVAARTLQSIDRLNEHTNGLHNAQFLSMIALENDIIQQVLKEG